jgi:hypothetical protein
MSKHTPGPWRTQKLEGDMQQKVHVRAEHLPIATVFALNSTGRGFVTLTDEEQANAALIAAAPEMLEALRKANAALKCNIKSGNLNCICEGCTAADAARAAIAKAEGRSA